MKKQICLSVPGGALKRGAFFGDILQKRFGASNFRHRSKYERHQGQRERDRRIRQCLPAWRKEPAA